MCKIGDDGKPLVTDHHLIVIVVYTIGTVLGQWSEPSSLPRHCCPWSGQVTVRRGGVSPQYHLLLTLRIDNTVQVYWTFA